MSRGSLEAECLMAEEKRQLRIVESRELEAFLQISFMHIRSKCQKSKMQETKRQVEYSIIHHHVKRHKPL